MQKVYLRASQNRGVVYDLKDYREEIGIANPWDCYNSDTPSCTGKVYNESAVSPSPSANNYALALASFVKQKCAAGCRHVLIVGDDFVVPSYRISFDEFGGIPQVDGLRNVNTSNFVSDMPFVSTTKKTISDKDDFFNEAEAVAIVVPDTVSPELRLAIEEFKNTLKLKYGLSYTPGAGNSTNMIKEYFSSEISCNSYFGHPLSNMTVVLIGNRENNNGVRCLPWFENEENMFSVYTNPWGSFISQKYVMVVNTDSPTILKFVSKMFEKDLMKSSNFDMITFANTQLDRCSFAGLLVGTGIDTVGDICQGVVDCGHFTGGIVTSLNIDVGRGGWCIVDGVAIVGVGVFSAKEAKIVEKLNAIGGEGLRYLDKFGFPGIEFLTNVWLKSEGKLDEILSLISRYGDEVGEFFLRKSSKLTDVVASSNSTLGGLIQNLSPSAKRVFEESAAGTDIEKAREAIAFANLEKKTGAKLIQAENEISSGADLVVESAGEKIAVSVKTFTSNNVGTIKDEILGKAADLAKSPAKTKKNVIYVQVFEDNFDTVEATIKDILDGHYGDTLLRNSNEFQIVVSKIPGYLR